jgi:hypothetical protein
MSRQTVISVIELLCSVFTFHGNLIEAEYQKISTVGVLRLKGACVIPGVQLWSCTAQGGDVNSQGVSPWNQSNLNLEAGKRATENVSTRS